MIANVSSSKNIVSTLEYDENKLKGGEVILSSGIDPELPASIQAKALEAMHNPKFKVKAHTIVISHGDKDSKLLTPELEKKYLKAFLKELEAEGIDLDSSPWVIARHGNTDNVHYHMAIMNTCYDRSRFKSDFLGAKATRAAAAVSLYYGLEGAPRAVERLEKTQSKRGKVKQKELLTEDAKGIAKHFYNRRAAIAAAKAKKEALKHEEAVKEQTNKEQKQSTLQTNRHQRDRAGDEDSTRKGWKL